MKRGVANAGVLPGRRLRPGGALTLVLAACVAPSTPWRGASDHEWPALAQALDVERAARPKLPWAAGVRATMRQRATDRELEARGALAVAPGRGLRMILVQGPGATALDVWLTPERWRIASPPMELLRRGGVEAPADLPVGFLRWWFFGPLRGTLSAVAMDERGRSAWLLRDGDAELELHQDVCDRGTLLRVTRRGGGSVERVDECRARAAPQVGDRIQYTDEAGLEIELVLESIARTPPPEAFDDPDARALP